jgi:putative exosortase-associated protein (TIGR04073 family)
MAKSVIMLKKFSVLVPMVVVSSLLAGCAGPEQKLGRGINNTVEFARGGEMRRSFEQTAIFDSPDRSYTTGMIRGFDKSMVRTCAGVYEVVTFPIPNHYSPTDYGAILHPSDPVYPDSYKPNWLSDTILSPDNSLGFSGGDIIPFIPGCRFHIFDN